MSESKSCRPLAAPSEVRLRTNITGRHAHELQTARTASARYIYAHVTVLSLSSNMLRNACRQMMEGAHRWVVEARLTSISNMAATTHNPYSRRAPAAMNPTCAGVSAGRTRRAGGSSFPNRGHRGIFHGRRIGTGHNVATDKKTPTR